MSSEDVGNDEPSERDDRDFDTRMRGEIEVWRSERIISPEVADALLARYESTEAERRSFSLNRLAGILAVMGVVLVGLGVIGLVAVNWSEISDFTKLVMMVTLVLTASYVMPVGCWRIGWDIPVLASR